MSKRAPLLFVSALLCGALALPTPASAGERVKIVVVKENGSGSASQAQGFVDRLMGRVAEVSGFDGAEGKYETKRAAGESWAKSNGASFGILSLGAFLDMRTRTELEVIGKVDVSTAGGREYHIVSKEASSLAECRGKSLGTNHADDQRFMDKVVSGSDWDLGDFEVVDTRRPMKTLKAVAEGEVSCALIDDAQMKQLGRVDGGDAIKSVWKSKSLPPMVVVAFPAASSGAKASFKKNLGKVCDGDGATACKEVGIKALKGASSKDYAAVVKAY